MLILLITPSVQLRAKWCQAVGEFRSVGGSSPEAACPGDGEEGVVQALDQEVDVLEESHEPQDLTQGVLSCVFAINPRCVLGPC